MNRAKNTGVLKLAAACHNDKMYQHYHIMSYMEIAWLKKEEAKLCKSKKKDIYLEMYMF
jgi:hypothetical protein